MAATASKLSIIQNALLLTGNNIPNTDDGSVKWEVASSSYDRRLPEIMAGHDWKFLTKLSSQDANGNYISLTRVGNSNYPGFQDIYAKPADCLQLIYVFNIEQAVLIVPTTSFDTTRDGIRLPAFDWLIIGDQIHCTANSGVGCKYVGFPSPTAQASGSASLGGSGAAGGGIPWSVLFVEALTQFVEADCIEGINEDWDRASSKRKQAEMSLQRARSRNDNEEPRRVMIRSGMKEARRYPRNRGVW